MPTFRDFEEGIKLLNHASTTDGTARPPPPFAYFDECSLEQEKEKLFRRSPNYVAHESMVPEVGDYFVPAGFGEGFVLLRNETGVQLLSNVCSHRHATLLSGRGSTKKIVCSFHGWTYDLHGKLVRSPGFSETPCVQQQTTPMEDWNGLLFTGSPGVVEDLSELQAQLPSAANFSDHRLAHVQSDNIQHNWKTLVEIYQCNYHIPFCHPGLNNFLNEYTTIAGGRFFSHTATPRNGLIRAGTSAYKAWQDQILRLNNGRAPEIGLWTFIYYPGLIVDWVADGMMTVVSRLIPIEPQKTAIIQEFYAPEKILSSAPEFIQSGIQVFGETDSEDLIIAERVTRGKRLLMEQTAQPEIQAAHYHPTLEAGVEHFHNFLRKNIQYESVG